MKQSVLVDLLLVLFASLLVFACCDQQPLDFRFAKLIGGTMNDGGRSCGMDSEGSVYIGGDFKSNPLPFTLDDKSTVNLVPLGDADVYLSKVSKTGQVQWAVGMGSSAKDTGYSVSVSAEQDAVYIGGSTEGAMTIGSDTFTNAGSADAFFAKFSLDGVYQWGVVFGCPYTDEIRAVVATDDAVYVAGFFREELTITTGTSSVTLTHYGNEDAFILKFSPAGKILWGQSIGGEWGELINGMTVSDGKVYVTGLIGSSTVNNGRVVPKPGEMDVLVAKLSAQDGSITWITAIGSIFGDHGYSVAAFGDGVYVAGHTYGSIAGSGAYYGNRDGFLAKLSASTGAIVWSKQIGGNKNDDAFGVVPTVNGTLLVTGAFEGAGTFGVRALTAQGTIGSDAYLAEVTTSGDFLWAKKYGALFADTGYGVCSSPGYIGASFVGTFSASMPGVFDKVTLTPKDGDGFVVQYGLPIYCNGKLNTDNTVCNGRGSCIDDEVCSCRSSTGYSGQYCEVPRKCYGISFEDAACSGHGKCTAEDTCTCEGEWKGDTCSTPIPTCYNVKGTSPTVCSGRGTCTQTDICKCNSGYGGFVCQRLCSNCVF